MNGYRVEGHGTSGRWWPSEDGVRYWYDALCLAHRLKLEGYGARIVREADGAVLVDASWQTPVNWAMPEPHGWEAVVV